MIDDKLKKFLKDGWLDLGYSLNVNKCKLLADKVLKSRPWDESIFRSYKDINENPRHANVVPTKNGYNLAEKYDLDFIENNTNLKKILNQILGKNYEIILKKFVVSAPKQIIPEWLEPIIDKKLDGNLAQYIKPELRDEYNSILFKKKIKLFKLIHSTAYVSKTAKINLGSVICPMAVVGSFAQIKDNVYINSAALIGHHSIIKKNTTVSPNCFLGGNSKIGSSGFVGAGANIYPGVEIKDYCKAAAGSSVTKNIPKGSLAYGNPAVYFKNK